MNHNDFRYNNGTGIPGAVIDVALSTHPLKKRQQILSTEGGDYYRLLLKGEYEVTATVNGLSITTNVTVNGLPAVVVDFVVGNDSITAQSIQPTPEPSVVSNAVESYHSESTHDDVKKETQQHKVVKSSRSDNVAAAFVIVTIGLIVCVLAGIVLFRKVKDLRKNDTKGGYAKINEEKFDAYEP